MAKKQEKLHCYMNPFQKWLNRWRLRRIIKALTEQCNQGTVPLVLDFVKTLEATEIITRGGKKNMLVSMEIERAQLDAFIRYMCSLHDAKLSRIMLARIGLATLITRDERILGAPAREILDEEIKRSQQPRSEVVAHASKQLRLDL